MPLEIKKEESNWQLLGKQMPILCETEVGNAGHKVAVQPELWLYSLLGYMCAHMCVPQQKVEERKAMCVRDNDPLSSLLHRALCSDSDNLLACRIIILHPLLVSPLSGPEQDPGGDPQLSTPGPGSLREPSLPGQQPWSTEV